MLQSIEQIYGDKLAGLDGDIGHVKDFYFDDQNWVIRYVVVDTGNWLPGRLVLITPHAIGSLHQVVDVLPTNLSRKQIEDSPSIDLHQPVSRQHEQAYYEYYGWPTYWDGAGLWGMSGFPLPQLPPRPDPVELHVTGFSPVEHFEPAEPADPHLRSAQAVKGYYLSTADEKIGHVSDFLVNPETWAVMEITVKTGHWFAGREIRIPTSKVKRISFDESTVFSSLTKADVEKIHPHNLASTYMVS